MRKNVFILSLTIVVSFLAILASIKLLLETRQEVTQRKELTQVQALSPTPQVTVSPTPHPIRLIFTGDAMFDRHIRTNARQNGYDALVADLTPVLQSSDLVITNLEGPITSFESRSVGSEIGSTNNYIFTFDPEITQTLTKNNIRLVNLGNNHILNFGEKGLVQTINYLGQANIQYFGNTGTNLVSDTITLPIQNMSVTFVNYNQFVPDAEKRVFETLQKLPNSSDIIIIYTHWGNEYITQAESVIQDLAHRLIEAGADLVIGSHPHVVQQSEIYQGKTIYYSLGNFIFDQYFSPEVQSSIILQVLIDPTTQNTTFQEIPIKMTPDGKTLLRYTEDI